MEIVDFHAHIFPDFLAPRAIATLCFHSPNSINHTDGTKTGLQNSMHQYGVTKAVILPVATKPSQVTSINQGCKLITEPELIPFGALHPHTSNVTEEIAVLKEAGVKGVKFHPEYQDFYIDNKQLFPIYEQLSAAGMIVVFHAGNDPGPFTCDHALPSALKNLHQNFPKLKIVAAHLGGWKLWDEVEQTLCGLPIYFDISAISTYIQKEQFFRIISKQGTEKILFGTDSPWFNQGEVISWLDSLKINTSAKELIFYKNANQLLFGAW
ncbi:MAG: amidohydrolase family protein [Fibrobacter sp.]|nr:amidohydrolase family protein [Fibrobacter sp.]